MSGASLPELTSTVSPTAKTGGTAAASFSADLTKQCTRFFLFCVEEDEGDFGPSSCSTRFPTAREPRSLSSGVWHQRFFSLLALWFA